MRVAPQVTSTLSVKGKEGREDSALASFLFPERSRTELNVMNEVTLSHNADRK